MIKESYLPWGSFDLLKEDSGTVVKVDAMVVATADAGVKLVVLKHRDKHSLAELNRLPLPSQPP